MDDIKAESVRPKLGKNWVLVVFGVLIAGVIGMSLGRDITAKLPFLDFSSTTPPITPSKSAEEIVLDEISKKNSAYKEAILKSLNNMSGVFDASNHSFRNIEDVAVIDQIAAFDEDHPVKQKIRDECQTGRGVCETSYNIGYVSWPSEQERYSSQKAYVCNNSSLLNQTLVIANLRENKAIILPAIGKAGLIGKTCNTEVDAPGGIANKDNFVQLSKKHYECLMGNKVADKLNKIYLKVSLSTVSNETKCIDI